MKTEVGRTLKDGEGVVSVRVEARCRKEVDRAGERKYRGRPTKMIRFDEPATSKDLKSGSRRY